jgi:parvulin-like peptidyl-prolyl isomerase
MNIPTARVPAVAAELAREHTTIQDLLKESGETGAAFHADLGLALRWEGHTKARVTETDAAKYYMDTKDFLDMVPVRAGQIVLRARPNASEADRAKTPGQLADLRSRLPAKQIDFAEAAKKDVQSPQATNGGDVGYVPRKFVVDDDFAWAASGTPVNGVGAVVRAGHGPHRIRVTERKAGVPSDYAKIKDGLGGS